MSFQNVIVTGANRGIGLEFVKQFLKLPNAPKNLIATTRKSASELDQLKLAHKNLHVLNYDATNYASYDEFGNQVKNIVQNDGVDLLINNAGIYVKCSLETFQPKDLLDNIEVNVAAPMMLTKVLLPLLKTSASARRTVIANISSKIGSIADNTSGGIYAYRSSKTALNMVSKSLAVDLKNDNIIVLSIHPGWVQTDMGGPNALIDTFTSVSNMIKVLNQSNMEQSGSFLNYDGKPIPY